MASPLKLKLPPKILFKRDHFLALSEPNMALERNAELRGFDFFLGADEEMSVQKNGKLFCDFFFGRKRNLLSVFNYVFMHSLIYAKQVNANWYRTAPLREISRA